ncbi:MAG: non-homologous end-joining DNA ligase [Anaerolineales bacterium]
MSETIQMGPYSFEAGNLDKVIFPEDGFTQREVLAYYQHIAETMLPHLGDRPVSMQRFPDGIQSGGFYQKEVPDYFPDWIQRVQVEVKEQERSQAQVVVANQATLAYLADQGCITLHTWLSRADRLDFPDKLIFDLDPPGDDFQTVREAALALRSLLAELDLVPFVMTTGSRGLHVVILLDRQANFEQSRTFAREVSNLLASRQPDAYTTEVRKEKRAGRLFLDYLRNGYAQTSVAPYTLRPKPGAPVATPLDWDELQDHSLTSQSYTLKNIFRRLGQKADPWQDIYRHARDLGKAREALERMRAS